MKLAQSGRRRLWLPAAVLAALCFVGAAVSFSVGRSSVHERPPAAMAPAVIGGPRAPVVAATSAARKARATALPGAGVPQGVVIDALGIDAAVLPIVMEGSTLNPPPDPQALGWWAGGAQPGAANGTALVTGHTVHDGGGALDQLETLKRGAEIRVRTDEGVIRYVTDSVEVFDKDTIARRATQLFSQGVDGRLVLVTCEDWDGTGYRSNVVVTAVPVT